eukprot:2887361-Amphidinium_carterae.1
MDQGAEAPCALLRGTPLAKAGEGARGCRQHPPAPVRPAGAGVVRRDVRGPLGLRPFRVDSAAWHDAAL